jgi:hypothetical protein
MKDFPERSEGVFIKPCYKISKDDYDKMKDMMDIDIRKEISTQVSLEMVRNNPQLDVDVLIDEFLRRPSLGEYLREAIKLNFEDVKRTDCCTETAEWILEKIEQWENW